MFEQIKEVLDQVETMGSIINGEVPDSIRKEFSQQMENMDDEEKAEAQAEMDKVEAMAQQVKSLLNKALNMKAKTAFMQYKAYEAAGFTPDQAIALTAGNEFTLS